VYETSASESSRPRQCVPLACIKYICRQSAVPTSVCHGDTFTELSRSVAAMTSGTQIHAYYRSTVPKISDTVPQTSANLTCSSGVRSSGMLAQYPTTNNVQRSEASHTVSTVTTLQNSRHLADVTASATATVGLASAVWTPMGVTLQPVPQQHAVETARPQQLRLLTVHHRLTSDFNKEFSQNMNAIISAMHGACRALTSTVFQYTLERLRMLRFEYCQLTNICIAYGQYQKNVRFNQSIPLPSVSCLLSSIKILMNSVETVMTVFREMHQWLSADSRMTVTERGLGLSNKLCHFAPVFLQEMGNFKRSLLMIVPNTVSLQSTSHATVIPPGVSSVMSPFMSSAATTETVTTFQPSTVLPVVAQMQENENVELQGQYIEPVFVARMPIVIEPSGQADDEFGLITVKQEPVETNRRRRRAHSELVYIADDADSEVSDVMTSAVDEDDPESYTLASHQFDEDSVGDIQTVMAGVSWSSLMPSCTDTAAATCTSAPCLESPVCSDNSMSTEPLAAQSLISVADTETSCADHLSSCMNVNCTSGIVQAFSGDQYLDVCPVDNAEFVCRSPTENGCHGEQSVTSVEGCLDQSASSMQLDHCLRNLSINQHTADLNILCSSSELNGDIPRKQSVNATANNVNDESSSVSKTVGAKHNDGSSEGDTLNNHSDLNNLCTITSICSIELERFDVTDTSESITVDDIVTAVHAFDENANIAFNKGDRYCGARHQQNSAFSQSLPVKPVKKKKKKKLPASRFARRRTQKQRIKASSSIGLNVCAPDCVAENVEDVVNDVDESNSCEETLHSDDDKETDDSAVDITAAVTDKPVCSYEEQSLTEMVECQDTNMEEAWMKGSADVTSQLLNAGCETAQHSDGIKNVLTAAQPATERQPSQTDMAVNTDLSSEPQGVPSVCVSSATAVNASDIDNGCKKDAGLESEKQESDEIHDIMEEKCSKQPETECRDSLLDVDDDDRINTPGKKKHARVIYDEEDVENEVCQTSVSVNGKSMHCTAQTSVQANGTKKLKKFISSNTESVSHRLKKKGVLVEKQFEMKMKKQKQCKQKHHEVNGKAVVDKCVTAEAASALSGLKHSHTAVRKHKLKKSKKLLKRGVKHRTLHLVKGSKVHQNVSSNSIDVTASRHVHQRTPEKLPTSQTPVVDVKGKASSQSVNVTVASSASIVPSCSKGDHSSQSARDKVNAIFRDSEFTRLHGRTSLVHSKRNKPALSSVVSSSDRRSENGATCLVSPLKINRIPRVNSHHVMPESVVTSGCVTSTAVTSSVISSAYKSVIRRPGVESSPVRTSTRVVNSDVSVKAKSGTRSDSHSAQMSQRRVEYASKLSSNSSLPMRCSSSVDHGFQNTIPSLLSLKLKPCLPKLTTAVSSVNNSIPGSQSLNISSAGGMRDPRLAQRKHSVSSEQLPKFGLNEHSIAHNLTTGTVGVNITQKNYSSVQWPWEQTNNAGIATKVSTSVGSVETINELSSCAHSTAGCWMWELDENTHASSSCSSVLSVDVNDILSDLTTSSTSMDYLQASNASSQWHSAARAVHSGILHTAREEYRASDVGANSLLPSDVKSVREPMDIMSPVEVHDSRQYVDENFVAAQRCPPSGNALVSVQSHCSSNNVSTECLSPHNKDPKWRLIPLDLSGILPRYNSVEKLPCGRKRCSSHLSDPRLKAASESINSKLHSDKSGMSDTTCRSIDTDCRLVVSCRDTDSLCDAQQTELMGDLDCSQSEMSPPPAESLDSRIGTLFPHLDTFSVDKDVEVEVDKLMTSWWNEDLDDESSDQQQHLEDNDSVGGHFIIIDDDDDDDNVDDDSCDGLVIDLDDSSVELTTEPTFTKSVTGRTVQHEVTRNIEHISTAETKIVHSTLSDKDVQSVAKENCRIDNPLNHQPERFLVTSSDLTDAGHHNKSVKHRNATREHTKQNTSKEDKRTESSNECSTDTSLYNKCDELVKSSVNNNVTTKRETHRYNSARNTHEMPVSSNTVEQSHERLEIKDAAKSHGKGYRTSDASASATGFDSTGIASTCIACLADVSEPELIKLNQHMETKMKALEQKITERKTYACPLSNLDEYEKQQLVADRLAEPAIVNEFSIELRLQSVQREIEEAEAAMAKIKTKFDPTRPSMSLEKKYDQYERVCNKLTLRMDWYYIRMNRLHRYHKSKCLLTLPDDLRFSSERGKFVSVEGVPLILNDCTISLHHCMRLAALLMTIKTLRSSPLTVLPCDVLQKLGWLYQERRTLLSEVCCSSVEKISHQSDCLSEKLTVYKYVT